MLADITSMRNAIIELKAVKNSNDFESILYSLRDFLKTLDMDPKFLMELEQRAYYPGRGRLGMLRFAVCEP